MRKECGRENGEKVWSERGGRERKSGENERAEIEWGRECGNERGEKVGGREKR